LQFSQQSLGFKKRKFTGMFIHPMHTPEYYFSTYNQLTVLQYYNIVSSVLSRSDLCMLRNLRKKTMPENRMQN